MVVGRDGRPDAGRLRVFQLWDKAVAFQPAVGRQAAKLYKSGIDIQQFGRPAAFRSVGDARTGKNHWDSGRAVPERVLAGDEFLAQMPAMIRPEDDNRVVVVSVSVESVKDSADLAVHETGARQIRTDQVLPLIGLFEELETGLGERPMQVPREPWRVVAIVTFHRR